MRWTPRSVAIWFAAIVAAVVAAVPSLAESLSERVGSVRIETDGAAGSEQVAATCAAAARALHARGWRTPPMVVRVLQSPYDATAPASDLALAADEPVEDAFFRTVEALVRRDLGRVAEATRARDAARLVAAHLSPPGSRLRQAWQREWVGALADGELVATALLETVWRLGGDALLRAVTAAPWPDGLIALLAEHAEGGLAEIVSQVVLAGLLDPRALGFEVEAPALPDQGGRTAQAVAETVGAGVRLYQLPARAAAESVSLLRSRGVVAHAVVRYAFPGQYDAVRLAQGEEVAVPLRGVSWAGIVVTGLADGAGLSLSSRPLSDFPVALERWDFEAGDGSATISWETKSHSEVVGFVVEALARHGEQGWQTLRREFVPVAEDGCRPFSYTFVEAGGEDVQIYRLSALTARGFLAEIGTFPVLTE